MNNINKLDYFKKDLEKRSKTDVNDAVLLLTEVNGNNKKRLDFILAFMAFFLGNKRIQEEEKNNFLFSLEFVRCLYYLDNMIKNTPAVQSDLKLIKKETSKKKGFDVSDTERHIALGSVIIYRRLEQKNLLNLLKKWIAVKER